MVKTYLNDDTKTKYNCHCKLDPCTSSWTYDDWHCTGCHWKGFGRADVEYGDDELKAEYEELKAVMLERKQAAEFDFIKEMNVNKSNLIEKLTSTNDTK